VKSGNNINEVDKEDEVSSPISGDNVVKIGKNEEVFDPEICQSCKQKVEAIRHIADYLKQELAANNFNHIIYITNNINRLFTILNDIKTTQNKRRCNLIWQGSTP
ncbi:1740_t:CDS:1, partial [Dentiscutata erythropus]